MAYETIPEFIDAMGGNTMLARAIGVKPNTVTAWRKKGGIPLRHLPALQSASREAKLKPKLTNQRFVDIHGLGRVER